MGNNKRQKGKEIEDEKYSDYPPLFPFSPPVFKIFPPFNF